MERASAELRILVGSLQEAPDGAFEATRRLASAASIGPAASGAVATEA